MNVALRLLEGGLSSAERWLLLRFIAVGVINTAFGYGAYCLFIAFGLPFPVAGFLALCAGIAWSFFTSGRLVFRQTLRGRFGRYVLVWVLIYVVNVVFIWLGMRLGLNAYLAGAAASLPTLPSAFFLQRFLVFGRPVRQAVRMTPPEYAARLEALFDLRMRQPLLFHLAAILAIGLMLAVYIRFFLNDYFSCTGCSPYFWSVIDEFVSLTTNGKWSSSGTMLSDAFSGAFPVYYNYMSDTLMTFLAGRLGVPPFHFSAIHYGPALGVLMTLVNYVSVYAVTRSIFVAALATIIITFMGDGILTDWMLSLYGYEGQEITYVKATIHVPVTALPSGTNAVLGLVLILPVLSVIFLAERNGSVVLFAAGGALLGLLFQAHTLTFMFVMSALCVFLMGSALVQDRPSPIGRYWMPSALLITFLLPALGVFTGFTLVHFAVLWMAWLGLSMLTWRDLVNRLALGLAALAVCVPYFHQLALLGQSIPLNLISDGTFRVVILAVLMLPHWIALALLLLNVRRYATRVPDPLLLVWLGAIILPTFALSKGELFGFINHQYRFAIFLFWPLAITTALFIRYAPPGKLRIAAGVIGIWIVLSVIKQFLALSPVPVLNGIAELAGRSFFYRGLANADAQQMQVLNAVANIEPRPGARLLLPLDHDYPQQYADNAIVLGLSAVPAFVPDYRYVGWQDLYRSSRPHFLLHVSNLSCPRISY